MAERLSITKNGAKLNEAINKTLDDIRAAGTFKEERVITSKQAAEITVQGSDEKVLNFCANNYLGLANSPDLIEAAKEALDSHGFGLASVRFICGTTDMHKELENYMRSVAYDRIEYDKFKRLYRKVSGHDLAPDTPESDFERPELKEAYDALLSANEYALFNGDHLLKVLDAQLTELDRHFKAGVPWSTAKPSFDAEFQLWMNSKD